MSPVTSGRTSGSASRLELSGSLREDKFDRAGSHPLRHSDPCGFRSLGASSRV